MSKAADAKSPQGDTNYYPDVIYNQSQYIYWMDHNSSGSNWGSNAASVTFTDVTAPFDRSLINGANGSAVTTAEKKTAYEKYNDADSVDANLIIAGSGDATHIDNLITIAENRKDAIVFASPERSDVVNVTMLLHRQAMLNHSLMVLDHLVMLYLIVVTNIHTTNIMMYSDMSH